jgi:hypothetical protein
MYFFIFFNFFMYFFIFFNFFMYFFIFFNFFSSYDIFPNGHPTFLTKSARDKVFEAKFSEAAAFGAFTTPEGMECILHEDDVAAASAERGTRGRRSMHSAARRNPESGLGMIVRSRRMLPEPAEEVGAKAPDR